MIPVLDREVADINDVAVKITRATGDDHARLAVAEQALIVLQLGAIATRLTFLAVAVVATGTALVIAVLR